ncbi:helix-turn-helix domain-containing protein [Solimonas marina]|uniref:Helix-turn-helix domain-containing protein n=1 Tax=Solimonas marina TaxID=2714601 RepID=A0A969WEE3_9GAMM|nr:helix-turn-helix domain-containing protein [Solimonas marina]NKF23235.1 helix-turn-helix domain-containing protein [Solimonas marina]
MKKRRRPKIGDSHVRIYGWEHEFPAYRTLSTDARALLIEFRALYNGGENRVFLSVRQMQERMGNVGQRRAQSARDELLDRGWVRMIEAGAFNRKTKQATVYALTNEPLAERDGATATKDYARWQPQKSTVAILATVKTKGRLPR